jgi:hypothetical protein
MSSALAIAGVTAVLRDLLNDGMINHNVSGVVGSTVTVTVHPPDRVASDGASEKTQLNLFLHQVTFNNGWRNHGLPSRDSSGRHRLTNPPLALDLHYLLSAYSAEELGGEILLGYAMQLLHETPVLDRNAIRRALDPSPEIGDSLPPALRALAESGLADQVEQIKLVPESLSTEDLSKFWTATQSHYRPTAAYLASVVLIEATEPIKPTLPVLSRGMVDPMTKRDLGVSVQPNLHPPLSKLEPVPAIQSVRSNDGQLAATPGATIELAGHHLDGTGRVVVLSNGHFKKDETVPAVAGNSPSLLEAVVPALPVARYKVAAMLTRPGDSKPRTSQQLELIIGPKITTPLPLAVSRDGNDGATITLSCSPAVETGQQVYLLLGTREVSPERWTGPASEFTFIVEQAQVGDYLVRLRVDGIDSPVIDFAAQPPTFFNYRVTIT